ncbi:protein translocase subunit SecD [Clostridium sp. 'deep sea']|uniref:protein translocase subunit SecD n=1 Tax=Clostridium sp. 'deep sea' TaxID=2779445 RepID=UPI0018969BD9|nr:protein translocase subunit SecD [Clostridium sp. 'deep sea']QOR36250.1 protein translocase subunit SecD [Clostridium sp. 'deep sea']
MRSSKSIIALILLIVIIGGAGAYVYYEIFNKDALALGLDLEGGVYVLLEADVADGVTVTKDDLEKAKAIIQNRVDQLGTKEPEITIEGGNRIRIAIPGVQDQEQVLDLVGKTALLEFKSAKVVDGQVEYTQIVSGKDLKEAVVKFDQYGKPYVALTFNDEAGAKMKEFTGKNVGELLYITLDDVAISTPRIEQEVGKDASISGSFTDEQAGKLALLLRSGSLPIPLVARETRAIGPKLGQDSLSTSMKAGIIGAILVLCFMIFFYRAFGLVADIALASYMTIVMAGLIVTNSTITLPGLAGLILGIGMAVDANIIIFERVKDEIRNGHSIRSGIETGFSRAIVTILDSNITTLIAAAVLYWFGSGPIRGFAVTLTMSILGSMITAVFITRWLLRLSVNSGLIKTKKAIGGVKEAVK